MTYVMKASKTIQYGNVKLNITVRGQTAMDHQMELYLVRKLYQEITGEAFTSKVDLLSPTVQALNTFVELVTRTEIVNGLPFDFATPHSDISDLVAMYNNVFSLPQKVVKAWSDLIDEADTPPGDPDTAPPDGLTEDQKKIQTFNENVAS